MPVGFATYEIARSGLSVSERGLDVIGHNIANVDTLGYTRQQAMVDDAIYHNEYGKTRLQQLGLGADIQEVRQIRHIFLDAIYRQENTSLGYWNAKNKTFQDVQSIIADPMNSGFQDVMNQFWDSWQELSKDPDSLTVRALVRQRGQALVDQINHYGTQFDKLQNDLDSEILTKVKEINDITSQIAKLNFSIMMNEAPGDRANDFRDQRNLLVDKLTNLTDADVQEMQDGQLEIAIAGNSVVHKNKSVNLYADLDGKYGIFHTIKLASTGQEVTFKSGTMRGLQDSRGMVLGGKGSIPNGTPNTKADIVFAVDVSDTSAAYLENVKSNINNYVHELMKTGMDYNLKLVTFDSNPAAAVVGDYGSDVNSFINGVKGLSVNTGSTANNDFGSVVTALGGMTYRQDSNKYAMVFTAESIGGNGVSLGVPAVDGYIAALSGLGMKTSVITDSTAGFEAGDAEGWDSVAAGTGGKLYSIDMAAADYEAVLSGMNQDIEGDVNAGFEVVSQSSNIIPDLRRRLNSLVNIMAREVNYLHRSGKTLGDPPQDGDNFFVAIDSSRPMEMGNIKLNDIFTGTSGLNNIVSSTTGAAGDNTIAQQISGLRNQSVMRDMSGVLSIDGYYQSVILDIGQRGNDAKTFTDNQQKLVESSDSQRQSIMGVSMDEEMTNMLKFKFAYDANAKTINVIDEMMDTMISRMGLVGR